MAEAPAMQPVMRRRFLLIALLAVPFGLYGWALVVATGAGYNGKIGPAFNGLACDWTIFYTAIRAWRQASLGHIYDQVWFGRMMAGAYKPWLVSPEPFPAFHYPPTWLLFLAPLSGLSMIASYAVGQIASLAALVVALMRTFKARAQYIFAATSLLLAPATSNNVLSGQNGLLICALFAAGLPLLESQPILAGAILGVASFKPQMLLMLPFALWGARNWRALGGAAASATGLAILSALVFGLGPWRDWIGLMLHPRHDVAFTGVDWGRLWDDSVFTCAQLLGLSKTGANLCQMAATLGAAACVFAAYRRPLPVDRRMVVFLAASVVGAPHVSPYDLVALALAATILAWNSLNGDYRLGALVVPFAAWLAPLYGPPRATPTGLLIPVVAFAVVAVALMGGEAMAVRTWRAEPGRLSQRID